MNSTFYEFINIEPVSKRFSLSKVKEGDQILNQVQPEEYGN